MASEKKRVLVLCTGNSCRSQMAEAWVNQLLGAEWEARSAGTTPAPRVHPLAVRAMAEVGIDIAQEYPKPWTQEVVQAADVVVTMGCGDTCPYFPGRRYEDWELTDPAGQPIEVVRDVRDDIEQRVRELVASLALTALR